jgi:hypothetical protein
MAAVKRKSIRLEVKAMVWDKTDGRCWYCGKELDWYSTSTGSRRHIEHLEPLSRGGVDDFDNLAVACVKCNARKHNRTVEEYRLVLLNYLLMRWGCFTEPYLQHVEAFCGGEVEREILFRIEQYRKFLGTYRVPFLGDFAGGPVCEYVI